MFKIASMPSNGLFLTCRSQDASPYLLVAAVIAIIAGSVLTGSLFRTLGYSALSLGAIGISTAVILLAVAYKLRSPSTQIPHTFSRTTAPLDDQAKEPLISIENREPAQTPVQIPHTFSSTTAPLDDQAKEHLINIENRDPAQTSAQIPHTFSSTTAPLDDLAKEHLISIENGDVDGHNELSEENLDNPMSGDLKRAMCNVNRREWLSAVHLTVYAAALSIHYPGLCLLGSMPVISKARFPGLKFSNEVDFQDHLLKQFPSVDSSYDAIPFFWHVGLDHWTLVYIDLREQTVEYYDSKRNYGNYQEISSILLSISKTLNYTFKDKTAREDNDSQKKDALQPDAMLCGFWVLYFLTNRLNPATKATNFNTLDPKEAQPLIEEFRVKVLKTLFKFCVERDRAEAEEMEAYREQYKEKGIYHYAIDAEKMTSTQRWKQILSGGRLKPTAAPYAK